LPMGDALASLKEGKPHWADQMIAMLRKAAMNE
jgi:hypothetical protein